MDIDKLIRYLANNIHITNTVPRKLYFCTFTCIQAHVHAHVHVHVLVHVHAISTEHFDYLCCT